jgi:hypothetical protein
MTIVVAASFSWLCAYQRHHDLVERDRRRGFEKIAVKTATEWMHIWKPFSPLIPPLPKSSLSGKPKVLKRCAEKSTGRAASVEGVFGKLRSEPNLPRLCRQGLSGAIARTFSYTFASAGPGD